MSVCVCIHTTAERIKHNYLFMNGAQKTRPSSSPNSRQSAYMGVDSGRIEYGSVHQLNAYQPQTNDEEYLFIPVTCAVILIGIAH